MCQKQNIMKNKFLFLLIPIIILSCSTQPKLEEQENGRIGSNGITYILDTTIWHIKNKSDALNSINKTTNGTSDLQENQIAGIYTIDTAAGITYPFIMVTETKSDSEPPSMDQLERELNAISVSLDEINPNLKVIINGVKMDRPVLIRKKKLILMNVIADAQQNQQIILKQAHYFVGKRIISIQLSYLKDQHEKYVDAFSKIVETIKF